MARPLMQELGYTKEFTVRDSTDHGLAESDTEHAPGDGPRWGKYPGVVVNPVDPELRGRMLVQVPDVWGPNISSWAHPCSPWGGMSVGMFVIPPIGANVWVEFMHGDPDWPIWTGFWWGKLTDSPPSTKLTPPGVLPQAFMESLFKHALVISDTPVLPWLPSGGILIKSGLSYIAISPLGVQIIGTPAVIVNGKTQFDAALCVLGTP